MDFKEIKQLIELVNKNELSYFHIQKEDFTLKLGKGSDIEAVQEILSSLPAGTGIGGVVQAPSVPAGENPSLGTTVTTAQSPATAADAQPLEGEEILSPMVGTFYRAPSPEADPFVKVGQEIDEDTTLCMIEAMKTYNEIKAERRGTILKVLVENGQPVQFKDPLFLIKPA